MTKEPKYTIQEAKKLAANHSSMGGHIAEVPEPIIRFFDDKRRHRNVSVYIAIYAVVGKHYYVDMNEEDDAVLDRSIDLPYRDTPTWRKCRDDEESRGRRFSAKFDSASDAAHYIRKIWNEEFSNKSHRLLLHARSFKKRLKRLGLKSFEPYNY